MSWLVNFYDYIIAENFFSILKTDYIYLRKAYSFWYANEILDRYMHFYNDERIQLKTGVVPLMLRLSS